MDTIVELLQKNSYNCGRNVAVLNFVKQNINIIFSDIAVTVESLAKDTSMVFCFEGVTTFNREYHEINVLMAKIILECKELMVYRGRKYKHKILYLLGALHNLPKVFLDTTKTTLCNIGVHPISQEDTIEYASSYIELKNRMK